MRLVPAPGRRWEASTVDGPKTHRGGPGRAGGRRVGFLAVAATVAAVALAACGSSGGSGGSGSSGGGGGGTATLNWYMFPDGSGSFSAAAANCSKASNGAYRINLNVLPNDADGQRQQMVRRLAAKDSSLDILGLDVTWEAEFSEAGWILPFTGARRTAVENGTLASTVKAATWRNQLVAAPLNTNTQLLWYRKDLVPNPPTTWQQMVDDATQLAKQGKPHFIEVQGAEYEGYTVLFNTLVASAGGSILNASSTKAQLGEPAVKAVQAIQLLAHSPAADPSWSNQQEDDNRLAFESGSAAFELNYPFIYPSALENAPALAKNIGWAQYPSLVPGQQSHVTIGGNDLAVSSYSKHPNQAFDAINCLRSRTNQITYAIKGGLPPTLESLYTDPALVKGGYPFASAIFTSLQNGTARPQTPAYQSVSLQISYTLSPPTSVKVSDLNTLKSRINDALNSKGLVP
jgi:multiple sugar transport system substrate-binding protein